MEAWVLHIRIENIQESGEAGVSNRYTAWMNEKQALKAAAKFLLESIVISGHSLRTAIAALVEVEKIWEAIDLVNDYSKATPHQSGRPASSKVQIIIVKSTFLGSPFD